MKTSSSSDSAEGRQGMSRVSLVAGLVLWIAVFAALYYLNSKRANSVEAPGENNSGESTEPIIVDKTDPDKPSASTAKESFPANPLPDFNLQNSEGGTIGLSDLKGKRWVASFVFSRCASTCPMISGAMMALHDRVEGKASDVMFITITVDPKYDTPEVFQKYAENFRQGDSSRWKFLTGDQQEIYELIVNGFGLYVAENQGEERQTGFEVAHTNRVVLVNEDSIPVGTYLGTRDEDMVKLRRILTGKSEFPQAGPPLESGAPNGAPLGLSFEFVHRDDEDENEEREPEAAKPNNDRQDQEQESDGSDAATSDEGIGTKKTEGETTTSGDDVGQQSMRGYGGRSFFLTGVMVSQDSDESVDESVPEDALVSDQDSPAGEVAKKPENKVEQSVAEFNKGLNRRLPAWARSLPTLNAALNSVATLLLLCGYVAIRKKKKSIHRNLMISAFLVSVAFLASYLLYHYALGKYTGEHGRRFEGTGIWALVYPWVLWPHVVLAVFVPVLGIRVFQLAFREDWDRHRRLARITFPIWLYVSVTGVVIYGMLYHWPAA